MTAAAATAVLLVTLPVAPAAAEDSTQCTFPSKKYPGRPWALQRVLLDELWKQSTGKGVRVAVIDTGVDIRNDQLGGRSTSRRGATTCRRASRPTTA
ncbi:hypothetical protein SBADM41S_08047 [Streptomyces badius]